MSAGLDKPVLIQVLPRRYGILQYPISSWQHLDQHGLIYLNQQTSKHPSLALQPVFPPPGILRNS